MCCLRGLASAVQKVQGKTMMPSHVYLTGPYILASPGPRPVTHAHRQFAALDLVRKSRYKGTRLTRSEHHERP